MLEDSNGGVARLQLLVRLNSQLRNLARAGQLRAAPPVAVASEGIHVGQDPACHYIVRLLAGMSQQVQPHSYAIGFQAHQQLFG
jgi:hypothetical protein